VVGVAVLAVGTVAALFIPGRSATGTEQPAVAPEEPAGSHLVAA